MKTLTEDQKLAYRELAHSGFEVGVAHGMADHTLSEMMLSVERETGRTIPVALWLDLFNGWEEGKRERVKLLAERAKTPRPYTPIDTDDLPY